MIGGVVADRAPRPGLRGRPLRAIRRGVRRQRARRCRCSGLSTGAARGRASPSCWWAHIALVAASCVYLPFSKHLHIATAFSNIVLPQARAARRAAGDGPRGGGRDVRPEDAPGPRLEGPPRRLHLHRVRPLPGGLPGLEHRQAAQPQDLHHGHPGHVGRGRARPRPDPELADRPRARTAWTTRRPSRRCWPRRSSTTRSRTTRSGTA